MPRIIYAPSNGPACSMEDLVAQYIDWSPTIYNDVSQGFYMAPEQMQYCPTKSQIKNSASMSVTLYKQAVYKDSSIIQFKNGTTYKFNGEIGQFPKLYVLDMYPDFKPTKQYSSKELVKLCDVSAFYNHHEITLRLNNFSLIDGQFPKVSSNLVIDSDNVHVITDSAIYPYDMKEETYFSWSLPKIDYVANKEQYKEDKFTYNVIGYDNLAGPYTLGDTIDVTDVERDVMIDVYAEKKDLINVYISTDGRVRVINYLSEFDLDSEEAVEPNIIIDPPSTYATYKTDYPEEKYDTFKFLIQPDDAESLESYKYEFKKNGVVIDSSSNLIFADKSSIYEKDLVYRDTSTSAPNSYTLMIITKEKYRGNNIRIIINNENADSIEIEVSEESSSSGFESVSAKTTSSKMEFSYVIQKESTEILYIRVTGNSEFLKDYDLINGIYASNNRGESTKKMDFGNGTDSVVLEWTYGVGRNTIIYIKIERTQLVDVTIKRLIENIDVRNNYTGFNVFFNKNVGTISTSKAHPSSINLTIKNRSTLSNVISYKWYVRNKVETNGYWSIGYNKTEKFTKEDLIPGKSYMLELNGGIAYTEKIVSVIINNSDSSAHITVSDGEWSNNGNSYNTLSVYSSENEGMTVKYKMTQGYYFRGTIHVQEDYKFSSCYYTCVFKGKNNIQQIGTTVYGSVEFDKSTKNFVIVIPNIPTECSYVTISTTYSSIPTYSFTVVSVANVNVYEYDYATQMFKVGSICTAGNRYTATVNTTNIKPNEVKLKFVSAAPDDYPTLIYAVYDTLPSREFIVTETAMDITGSGTVWTSPQGMFETYGNDINFQVMRLISNERTIYIYTTLTDIDLIIKDNYNSNKVIADFSSNSGNYVSYKTISGYYDRVSWGITWPTGYVGCDLELFGSDNATSPTSGTWVKVGSTKTEFEGTTLNFVWGHDLDGNNATEYSKYYIKFSNFKSCSLEYIGISTEAQSIDKISSYSKTNFIPTTGRKTFNVLFRIPTTPGTLSIIPAIVNDGIWVNPDGTLESSPYTTFRSFCGNGSNTAIDHTDGYTYIFYGFSENAELYGKYYVKNAKYIYSNQTIKNAITFRNPKLTTETIDIDVYLDEICKLSWVYQSVVGEGSHKEFSRYEGTDLYFWAKLEKMKSSNCESSFTKVVYEFSIGDLTLTPSDGFTLVEMGANPLNYVLYGGSARWQFSHITFNEGQTFIATLQHGGRTITLRLRSITPDTPVTYATHFWYTKDVTTDLATNWYWWTPEDPNTTLLTYSTSYGLGVHYNTPTSISSLDGDYYKCGPSDIALIRNGSDPQPVEMVNGQTYILVYNSSQNSTWLSTGVKFVYIKPTNAARRLICDGKTVSEDYKYVGCYYDTNPV